MFSPLLAIIIAVSLMLTLRDKLVKIVCSFVLIISIFIYIIQLYIFDLGIQIANNFPLLILLDFISILLILLIFIVNNRVETIKN